MWWRMKIIACVNWIQLLLEYIYLLINWNIFKSGLNLISFWIVYQFNRTRITITLYHHDMTLKQLISLNNFMLKREIFVKWECFYNRNSLGLGQRSVSSNQEDGRRFILFLHTFCISFCFLEKSCQISYLGHMKYSYFRWIFEMKFTTQVW